MIFFLTDGDFSAEVAEHVARLNTSNVVIQTIAFLDRAGEQQLRRIGAIREVSIASCPSIDTQAIDRAGCAFAYDFSGTR